MIDGLLDAENQHSHPKEISFRRQLFLHQDISMVKSYWFMDWEHTYSEIQLN